MENVIKRQAKSNSNKKNEDLLGNNSQYSETEPLISSEEKIHKKPFNFNNFVNIINIYIYIIHT